MKTRLIDWPFWDATLGYDEQDRDGIYMICIDVHIDRNWFGHYCVTGCLN